MLPSTRNAHHTQMLTASPGCTSNGALQRFTGTKAADCGDTGAHEVQGGN
jgi:hypothetical protein